MFPGSTKPAIRSVGWFDSMGLIGLLAICALPATALAAPRLRCTLDQGGTTQTSESAPVTDPYRVESTDINGRFRFKAVAVGDEQQVRYVKLYSYYRANGRWMLLHEARYETPAIQTGGASDALTGRHFLYSPGRERELQYGCTLIEVAQ
ncbi:hypothetical protein CCR95_15955 [Thiocystis minor]|uniref:hypothetical protein n=1 Tax=Thiocystis minor TaxID=61597 RepID=UPI0019145DFC|nr:hypothetical protein [Thiocystis minor]MBK5965541.1 hypothetical protein [Thiocystis minor]